MRKIYGKFNPKEERLLIGLAIAVFIGILSLFLINKLDKPQHYVFSEKNNTSLSNERRTYQDLPNEVNKVENNYNRKSKKSFIFNPNQISKDSLLMLGIDQKTATNLLEYREKGGKINNEEKFFKIYGMEQYKVELKGLLNFDAYTQSPSQYSSSLLTKSIIANDKSTYEKEGEVSAANSNHDKILPQDEVTSNRQTSINLSKSNADKVSSPNKFININSTDSFELMGLKGIGRYLSSGIIKYRDKLGGYYDISQLEEVYGMRPETYLNINHLIKIDPSKIRKIKVNQADIKTLGKHPYMGYKKGEIIILYRNNHEPFRSINDLMKVKIFSKEELDKLQHYLSFEE